MPTMFAPRPFAQFAVAAILTAASLAQSPTPSSLIEFGCSTASSDFPIAANSQAAAIYVSPQSPATVRVAAEAFASDVAQVTGLQPRMIGSLDAPLPADLILVGMLGQSPEIDALVAAHRLDASAVAGKWESAVTAVIAEPMPGVRRALVIAGSDRRGAAFALFTLSRQMGVSPWTWWADVPVAHHAALCIRAGAHLQPEPSVQYRGIFLNDEDWGLRPWASKKMDPAVDGGKGNIGPHTYERIFELLLRLRANSLWPAMHPGSLAFNAVSENAKLADKWGIVMGSSHSEALLRNNVGEWNEKTDGPWNYQLNAPAMNAYWDKRLVENGNYENFYTVGLRGVHDSGLEAKGTPEVKARLVEDVMAAQRALLAKHISPDLPKIPQIIWLYKESLDLYRVGMKVPPDVTLGWTDDNYGYLRELPNAAEQARPGGSGVYYHVSYWGAPHDYLWLCTTPPALIREEMTKAYDHNARRYWILNVGDLKPAEIDIDYFMQLAWDEPGTAKMTQEEWLTQWYAQQFPPELSKVSTFWFVMLADTYRFNFIRKPEFMGFNGYNDGIKRTEFNPMAWPGLGYQDQNRARTEAWLEISNVEQTLARYIAPQYASAFFELAGYPVAAAAAMNDKFLATDLTYDDAHNHDIAALAADTARAHAAYDKIQTLTRQYDSLEGGKWDGMMSDHPRDRHVFEAPLTATAEDANLPLPASWDKGSPECAAAKAGSGDGAGFVERYCTVSINAAHFVRKSDTSTFTPKVARRDPAAAQWTVVKNLGITGDLFDQGADSSIVYGRPGLLANLDLPWVQSGQTPEPSAWLEYDFATTTSGPATLAIHLLPTFPVDSDHRLRYAVSLDHHIPIELDAAAPAPKATAAAGDGPANSGWADNVLRNDAIASVPLGPLTPGPHTITLFYRDPGVVFQHLVLAFPGAPPAYPVPPETR